MDKRKEGNGVILLSQLIKGLWRRKFWIVGVSAIGLLIGTVIAYSLPREYSSSSVLAPEKVIRDDIKLSGVGQLASSLGMSNGYNSRDEDALAFTMYPDIVKSRPFVERLINIKVETVDGREMYLHKYMATELKAPWWKGNTENTEYEGDHELKVMNEWLYACIAPCLNMSEDKRTMVLSLSVKTQDARVSYMLAEAVIEELSLYIKEYRMGKIANDMKYAEEVFANVKVEYDNAYSKLESYENGKRAGFEHDAEYAYLKNEFDLKYSVYSNLSINLTEAKLRLNNIAPVYAVIVPPVESVGASHPQKSRIMFMYTLLFGLLIVSGVVLKDKLI